MKSKISAAELLDKANRSTLGFFYIILGYFIYLIGLYFIDQLILLFGRTSFISYSVEHWEMVLVYNALCPLAVWALLYAILNRFWIAHLIVAGLLGVIAVANYIKYSFLAVVVVPSDLRTLPFFLEIAPTLLNDLWPALVGAAIILLFLAAAFYLSYRTRRPKIFLTRVAMASTALAIFYVFTHPSAINVQQHFPKRMIKSFKFSKTSELQLRGYFYGFYLSFVQEFSRTLPETYSSATIDTIKNKYELEPGVEKNEERPNIVFVLLESFFDPIVLEKVGVKISPDPIPFFRSLTKTHSSGKVVVPVYGGGTSLTEFEVLSGIPSKFVKGVPYVSEVTKPIDSLPEFLSDKGYRNFAVHPHTKYFWNRAFVYSLFGFEKFYNSSDGDFAGAPMAGRYVSDQAVYDKIIAIDEEVEQPYFAMAVTMSTHVPFNKANNPQDFQITYPPGTKIDSSATETFETYLKLINLADQAMNNLIKYFTHSDRKTVVVFFGDHLPALTDTLFGPTGYADYAKSRHDMYKTPALIWTNFKRPRQEFVIGTHMLAAKAIQTAGLRPEGWLSFVSFVSKYFSVIGHRLTLTGSGVDQSLQNSAQLEDDFKMLSIDMLQGEQYFIKEGG